jgi:glucose-6-phosphate 1-dehydrogenase
MVHSALLNPNHEKHDKHVGFKQEDPVDCLDSESFKWLKTCSLTVVVLGASGDLAKKKTYPSLLNLFVDKLLPDDTAIFGYARSKMTNDDLRDRLRPFLEKTDHTKEVVDKFLSVCHYQGGSSYGDKEAFQALQKRIEEKEASFSRDDKKNRLFYFAIPPNVFGETALAIKETCIQKDELGWSRLIVEKPFGRDLDSFEDLNKTLSVFSERMLYRIDHYLGVSHSLDFLILRS